MKACIIAVGSEMLTPFRVDTNSLVITERLNTIGYDVRLKLVVGDDTRELAEVFEGALAWASRARGELLLERSALATERDTLVREASELLASVLGEALTTGVAGVRDRLERALQQT